MAEQKSQRLPRPVASPQRPKSAGRVPTSSPSRPERRARHSTPEQVPVTLVTQSTLTEDDDSAVHSRESCTPVICQHPDSYGGLANLDIQPIDATTPVLVPEQSSVPPVPESPTIKLTAPPPSSESSGYGSNLLEDPTSLSSHREPRYLRDRPGSMKQDRRKSTKKNIGIVIGDFNGLYGDELSLKVGEEIEIISKDTVVSRNIGWWTGRKTKKNTKIGIFPAACVSCDIQPSGASNSSVHNPNYPLEIKNSEVDMKEPIGMGGFGKVYRAIYKGEEVAVKVAKSTTFDSLKAVQDVIAEAEKFAHLAHPNICALVGVVLVKDVCLVMEYARGKTLSDILHKSDISLPIDVITNWTGQIASGMHYLHHEINPSLIHRDLKTSNILLSNVVDPNNLTDNTIKITDFGLAREIEHTTHMSGAGTYPWMAPEVIRTSDFSKKSDVWSFAVVMWELVTGERPYGGLSLFTVAYGVGYGSLSLPIPESCPEQLKRLMEACWKRNHVTRPSFERISAEIKSLQCSEFCSSTSHEDFKTMQSMWRGEIQQKFVELKKMQIELQQKEEDLRRQMMEQEERRKKLEEDEKKLKEKEKRLEEQERITRHQQEQLQLEEKERVTRQQQQGQQLHLNNTTSESDGGSPHTAQLMRPPRTKPFSIRKLIRKLWTNEVDSRGSRRSKVDNPLPDRQTFRRITSSPASGEKRGSVDRHQAADRHAGAAEAIVQDLMGYRGHKRRSSDECRTSSKELLTIDTGNPFQVRRGSVPSAPTSPNSSRSNVSSYQPVIGQHRRVQQQKSVPASSTPLKDRRSPRPRSHSDLRSPSPQQFLLPSYAKMTGPSCQLPQPQPLYPSCSAPHSKPAHLGLLSSKGKFSQESASSPGSPNVMITPADHPLGSQYDSGKDSMTCSDASGHSNCSESQANMIKLDSPEYHHHPSVAKNIDFIAAQFDPLIKRSYSPDSLLSGVTQAIPTASATAAGGGGAMAGAYHTRGSLEGTPESSVGLLAGSSGAFQWGGSTNTSPKSYQGDSISPKQSLTSKMAEPSPSTIRPRPRPSKEFCQAISAPSSRPQSPGGRERSLTGDRLNSSFSLYGSRRGNNSPTGSVQSMRVFMDSDGPDGFYFDSDAASTTSSLIDFTVDLEQEDIDEQQTMVAGEKYSCILTGLLDFSAQQQQQQ